jgi:hypothetical protein
LNLEKSIEGLRQVSNIKIEVPDWSDYTDVQTGTAKADPSSVTHAYTSTWFECSPAKSVPVGSDDETDHVVNYYQS